MPIDEKLIKDLYDKYSQDIDFDGYENFKEYLKTDSVLRNDIYNELSEDIDFGNKDIFDELVGYVKKKSISDGSDLDVSDTKLQLQSLGEFDIKDDYKDFIASDFFDSKEITDKEVLDYSILDKIPTQIKQKPVLEKQDRTIIPQQDKSIDKFMPKSEQLTSSEMERIGKDINKTLYNINQPETSIPYQPKTKQQKTQYRLEKEKKIELESLEFKDEILSKELNQIGNDIINTTEEMDRTPALSGKYYELYKAKQQLSENQSEKAKRLIEIKNRKKLLGQSEKKDNFYKLNNEGLEQYKKEIDFVFNEIKDKNPEEYKKITFALDNGIYSNINQYKNIVIPAINIKLDKLTNDIEILQARGVDNLIYKKENGENINETEERYVNEYLGAINEYNAIAKDLTDNIITTYNKYILNDASYVKGTIGAFNQGALNVLDNVDKFSKTVLSIIGVPIPKDEKSVYGILADEIRKGLGTPADMPDNILGDILTGTMQMLPELAMIGITPEFEIPYIAKVTNGTVRIMPKFVSPFIKGEKIAGISIKAIAPKFATYEAIKHFTNKYQDIIDRDGTITLRKDLGDLTMSAFEGFTYGYLMHNVGVGANKVGELVGNIQPSTLVTATTTATATGTGFGAFDILTQYIATGEIDPRQVAVSFGTGVAFSVPMIFRGIMSDSYKAYLTSDRNTIRRAVNSPLTPKELFDKIVDLKTKINELEKQGKLDKVNDLKAEKNLYSKILKIKTADYAISQYPEIFIEEIDKDNTLTKEQKQYFRYLIYEKVTEVNRERAKAGGGNEWENKYTIIPVIENGKITHYELRDAELLKTQGLDLSKESGLKGLINTYKTEAEAKAEAGKLYSQFLEQKDFKEAGFKNIEKDTKQFIKTKKSETQEQLQTETGPEIVNKQAEQEQQKPVGIIEPKTQQTIEQKKETQQEQKTTLEQVIKEEPKQETEYKIGLSINPETNKTEYIIVDKRGRHIEKKYYKTEAEAENEIKRLQDKTTKELKEPEQQETTQTPETTQISEIIKSTETPKAEPELKKSEKKLFEFETNEDGTYNLYDIDGNKVHSNITKEEVLKLYTKEDLKDVVEKGPEQPKEYKIAATKNQETNDPDYIIIDEKNNIVDNKYYKTYKEAEKDLLKLQKKGVKDDSKDKEGLSSGIREQETIKQGQSDIDRGKEETKDDRVLQTQKFKRGEESDIETDAAGNIISIKPKTRAGYYKALREFGMSIPKAHANTILFDRFVTAEAKRTGKTKEEIYQRYTLEPSKSGRSKTKFVLRTEHDKKAIDKITVSLKNANVNTPLEKAIALPYLEARLLEAQRNEPTSKKIIRDLLSVYNRKNDEALTLKSLEYKENYKKLQDFFTSQHELYIKNRFVVKESKLQKIFDKLKEWFEEVFFGIEGKIDDKVANIIKDIYGLNKGEAKTEVYDIPAKDFKYSVRKDKEKTHKIVYVDIDKVINRHAEDNPKLSLKKKENQNEEKIKNSKYFIETYAKDPRPLIPIREKGFRYRTGRSNKYKKNIVTATEGRFEDGKLILGDGKQQLIAAKRRELKTIGLEVPKEQAERFEKEFKITEKKVSRETKEERAERLKRNADREIKYIEDEYKDYKSENEDELRYMFFQGKNAEITLANSRDPQEIYGAWKTEKERNLYDNLMPWEQDLLGYAISEKSLEVALWKNMPKENYLQRWYAKRKGKDRNSDLDEIAQEISSINGIEVTVEQVLDFILSHPDKSVPDQTAEMTFLARKYRAITGRNIRNHEKFMEELKNAKITQEQENIINKLTPEQFKKVKEETEYLVENDGISLENFEGWKALHKELTDAPEEYYNNIKKYLEYEAKQQQRKAGREVSSELIFQDDELIGREDEPMGKKTETEETEIETKEARDYRIKQQSIKDFKQTKEYNHLPEKIRNGVEKSLKYILAERDNSIKDEVNTAIDIVNDFYVYAKQMTEGREPSIEELKRIYNVWLRHPEFDNEGNMIKMEDKYKSENAFKIAEFLLGAKTEKDILDAFSDYENEIKGQGNLFETDKAKKSKEEAIKEVFDKKQKVTDRLDLAEPENPYDRDRLSLPYTEPTPLRKYKNFKLTITRGGEEERLIYTHVNVDGYNFIPIEITWSKWREVSKELYNAAVDLVELRIVQPDNKLAERNIKERVKEAEKLYKELLEKEKGIKNFAPEWAKAKRGRLEGTIENDIPITDKRKEVAKELISEGINDIMNRIGGMKMAWGEERPILKEAMIKIGKGLLLEGEIMLEKVLAKIVNEINNLKNKFEQWQIDDLKNEVMEELEKYKQDKLSEAKTEQFKNIPKDLQGIEIPELVEMVETLIGDMPKIKNLKEKYLGLFRGTKNGEIILNTKLFESGDVKEIAKTLAREIGHLVDWLPDKSMGRIAVLKNFVEKYLTFDINEKGELTKEDIERLKKEAREITQAVKIEREIEEILEHKIKITTQDILSIWTDYYFDKNKYSDLYDFISRLSTKEKKNIVAQALKGVMPDILKQFQKTEYTKTGKKIKITDIIKGDFKETLKKLIELELKKRKIYSEQNIKGELYNLSKQWRPFDEATAIKKYIRYRRSAKELYADAISVLLNDPELLQKEAPTFFDAFFNYIDKKPEFKKAFENTLDLIKDSDKLMAHRLERLHEGYKRAAEKRKIASERKRDDSMSFKDRLIHGFLSETRQFYKNITKEKFASKDLKTREKVRNLFEGLSFANQEFLYLYDMEKEVHDAFTEIGVRPNEFGALLQFERNLKETNKATAFGLQGKDINERMINKVLERFRNDPEALHKIDEIKDKFRDRFFKIMEDAHKVGLISDEFMEEVVNPNKNTYVTFALEKYIDTNSIKAAIISRKGSFGATENPFISTMYKAIALIRATKVQEAKLAYIDAIKNGFIPGQELEPAKRVSERDFARPKGPNKEVLTYYKDGKKNGVIVDKETANFFKFEDPKYALENVLLPVIQFNKIFKPLVTSINPKFALYTNFWRDTMSSIQAVTTIINSSKNKSLAKKIPSIAKDLVVNPLKFIGNVPRNIMTINRLKKGTIAPKLREMLENNAVDFKSGISEHYDFRANIEFDIHKYGYGEKGKTKLQKFSDSFIIAKPIIKLWNGFTILRDAIEFGSKRTSYELLKKAGFESNAAGFYVRNYTGTPNYKEKGEYTKILNNIWVFGNVTLQGLRSQSELRFKKDTRGVYFAADMAYNIMPAVITSLAYYGLFGDDIKRMLRKVTPYNLRNYHIIPLGENKNGDVQVLRKPINEPQRMVREIIMGSIDAVAKEKTTTETFGSFIKDIAHITSNYSLSASPFFDIVMAAYDYLIEDINPVDTYYGKGIIPKYAEKGSKSKTYPYVAEYMIKQAGGGYVLDIWNYFNDKDIQRWRVPITKAAYIESNYSGREIVDRIKEKLGREQADVMITKRDYISSLIEDKIGIAGTDPEHFKQDFETVSKEFNNKFYQSKEYKNISKTREIEKPTKQQQLSDEKLIKIILMYGVKNETGQMLSGLLSARSAHEQTEIANEYLKEVGTPAYITLIEEAKKLNILMSGFIEKRTDKKTKTIKEVGYKKPTQKKKTIQKFSNINYKNKLKNKKFR